MKTHTSYAVCVIALTLVAVGCGNEIKPYTMAGDFVANVTDPASNQPASQRFTFPMGTQVPTVLPAGQTTGLVGVCGLLMSGQRLLQFERRGALPNEIRWVHIELVPEAMDSCTQCQHGTLRMILGDTTFNGVENRGNDMPSSCTFTTRSTSSTQFSVSINCPALTASGDSRTVAVTASLDTSTCTYQATGAR